MQTRGTDGAWRNKANAMKAMGAFNNKVSQSLPVTSGSVTTVTATKLKLVPTGTLQTRTVIEAWRCRAHNLQPSLGTKEVDATELQVIAFVLCATIGLGKQAGLPEGGSVLKEHRRRLPSCGA
jgi:hypothetical protein